MNMMKKTKLKNGLIKFGATGFYTGFTIFSGDRGK